MENTAWTEVLSSVGLISEKIIGVISYWELSEVELISKLYRLSFKFGFSKMECLFIIIKAFVGFTRKRTIKRPARLADLTRLD